MNGKRRISVLSALVVTLLVSLVLTASSPASPVSTKKAQLRRVQAKLSAVYKKADIAVEKYNQASSQLATVKQAIKDNRHLLEVAEYNLEVANQQLEARAKNIYKTRDVSVVDVIFAANSFDDLVVQLDLMERLGDSDVDTVKSIAAYQQDIKDRRVKLEADQESAARLVKVAAAQKSEILDLQNKLEDMTAGIKSDIQRLEDQAAQAAEQEAQDDSGGSSGTVTDPGGSGRSGVASAAIAQLGKPYVYGTAGPDTFDCSGLAMFCYAAAGVSIPRTATAQQAASTPVPLNALQPGDLVFFGTYGNCYHVGISMGGSSMIHAPHTGDVVSYGSISGAFIGGRF